MPYLIVEDGPTKGQFLSLSTDPVSFGRTADNTFPIQSQKASRRHAEIVADDGGYFVRDLGSSNGTFLNGELIQEEVELLPGDCVQIAEIVFRFTKDQPSNEAVHAPQEKNDFDDGEFESFMGKTTSGN